MLCWSTGPVPVPIHLPCCQCQPVLSSCWEKKKMAIGKLVGVLHITTFTKGLSILTCWVLTCSPGVVLLQFWARVRVSAWLFYSNCLDVRLYFCQFLFWCSFMWFLFAAFWRALFVDVHWLALNCLELQPCLPQLGSPFFTLDQKDLAMPMSTSRNTQAKCVYQEKEVYGY